MSRHHFTYNNPGIIQIGLGYITLRWERGVIIIGKSVDTEFTIQSSGVLLIVLSISISPRAPQTTPEGHPDPSGRLNNLGI